MSDIKRLKIGTTDIFLENLGPGKGKIIIADPYGGNYSNFWGSMGGTIEEFICSINFGYFDNKVNPYDRGVFDGKASVTNIRRFIREEYSYDLPWYENMEAQKELRAKLRELESCESGDWFVTKCERLADDLDLYDMDYKDAESFRGLIRNLMSEPWHYIGTRPSSETLFLKKLFPKLQKRLKKDLKSLVETK